MAELSSTPGHGAAVTLFTGSTGSGADHNAQCESIDQYLARTKGLGNGTRFPTLNLGVGSMAFGNTEAIAHAPGGAIIRNQVDPVAVFDQVFASLAGGTSAAAAEAARRRGQSVIDFVRGDLSALWSTPRGADQHRDEPAPHRQKAEHADPPERVEVAVGLEGALELLHAFSTGRRRGPRA